MCWPQDLSPDTSWLQSLLWKGKRSPQSLLWEGRHSPQHTSGLWSRSPSCEEPGVISISPGNTLDAKECCVSNWHPIFPPRCLPGASWKLQQHAGLCPRAASRNALGQSLHPRATSPAVPLSCLHCSAVGLPCTHHPAQKSPQVLQHRVLSKVSKKGAKLLPTPAATWLLTAGAIKRFHSHQAHLPWSLWHKISRMLESCWLKSPAEPQLQLPKHLTIITWVTSPLPRHPSGGRAVLRSCACSALAPPPTASYLALAKHTHTQKRLEIRASESLEEFNLCNFSTPPRHPLPPSPSSKGLTQLLPLNISTGSRDLLIDGSQGWQRGV